VSEGGVQLVIGKLLTDADFRQRFEVQGRACLVGLREQGVDLNEIETAALIETDPGTWSRMTTCIDPRLQRGPRAASEAAVLGSLGHLTARQQRVLSRVCEGLRNKQIAAVEGVSVAAVKSTLQQLFRKAGVRRRQKLLRLVFECGLDVGDHRCVTRRP
jgi:DNA-binding CsgD family transcriptional regulator